jgi:MFS family permease
MRSSDVPPPRDALRRQALAFIVLMGVVSLLADMVYEGDRSLSGPYLALLGASGAAVGLIAGLGELIAYGLRLLFGYLSDRTRRYWAFTIAGYALTALAVPALALAGSWQIALLFLTIERVSKALRSPAKDTLLSYATGQIGHGKGFGLHEALDQIGAIAAPLLLAAVVAWRGDYRLAFALLLIPGALSVVVLLVARARFPQPADLQGKTPPLAAAGFPRRFWLYLAGIGLIAAGYADFPLVAFHLERATVLPSAAIPALYALAMAVDAVAAYLFGALYDRVGFSALIGAALLSAGFAPLAFSGSLPLVLVGVALWGIGMGAQESVLRAAVAGMVGPERRGTAYGLFNTGYGLCWFAGSAALGLLYDVSLPALMAVSVALQLAAVAVLLLVRQLPDAPTAR